jgi:hypothetical protein
VGERWGLVRRCLAVVVLAVWLAMIMVSAWTTQLHVCSDEVARVGSTALVQSCGSLSITDPPSLALLVVAGLLLLPDLTSLEIPGMLRVERKLEKEVNDAASSTAKAITLANQQEEKREQFESPAS